MADRAGGRERPVRVVSEITPFFLVNRTPVYFHRRDAGQPARPGSLGNFDYLTSYDSLLGLARIRAQLRPGTSRTPSSRAVRR